MPAMKRHLCLPLLITLSSLAVGCTVLSTDEDRALRERSDQAGDSEAFVKSNWDKKVLPVITKRALPLPDLIAALSKDFVAAGKAHGHQVGEGSPWNFAVRSTGTVTSIDRSSQRGTISISVPSSANPATAVMQVGPYISDTAVRNAVDSINFNDFKDQMEYADIGNSLTARAMKETGTALNAVKPGDRIEFLAVANIAAANSPIILTPVQVKLNP